MTKKKNWINKISKITTSGMLFSIELFIMIPIIICTSDNKGKRNVMPILKPSLILLCAIEWSKIVLINKTESTDNQLNTE